MSEILADAGIAHTVCVATEYGEIVMREQTESTKAMQTAGQQRKRFSQIQMYWL